MKNEDELIIDLKKLYSMYGFTPFKMNKFEEYDLYALNRDFLSSKSVLSFTDGDGSLLALKPDVTLSIVKNRIDSSALTKVFYNENVYRIPPGAVNYKEIMQVGLECIGDLDAYNIYEIIILALRSLALISDNYKLSLSNPDVIEKILDEGSVKANDRKYIFKLVENKNADELMTYMDSIGLDTDKKELLIKLITLKGDSESLLNLLKSKEYLKAFYEQIKEISALLNIEGFGSNINWDFSLINDTDYYKGLIFKGYIEGIAKSVLSGGSYDRLLSKMHKKGRAIGFALYLDTLSPLFRAKDEESVDVLLYYNDKISPVCLLRAVESLQSEGLSVLSSSSLTADISYKSIKIIDEGGVIRPFKEENNA